MSTDPRTSPRLPPSVTVLFARALARRCPWCGNRRLFRRWFGTPKRCQQCGLKLERTEGAWLGSITINYSVTALVGIVVLIVWLARTLPGVDLLPLTAGTLGVVVFVSAAFYPFSKTLWAALDLLGNGAHRGLDERLAEEFGVAGEPGEGKT